MARNEAAGKARLETEVDPSGIKTGMESVKRTVKSAGDDIERSLGRQSTGALGKLGASVDGIVGKFNKVAQGGGIGGALLGGVGLGAGLTAYNLVSNVVTGTIAKIGQSLTLASDKAEAASKANVLFGDSYGIIEKASKTSATAVGLSSGAYLEAAGNLGNLITNFGITGDAGAKMAKSMVQLAADMGSFNNASTEEVTQAMGSAMVGETEPIRRFGVMLSAAAVAAKAVELGLAKSTKNVSQAAKVQATYALILEQTTKAQGDFARTSDGKANADRIRAAQAEEALTKLGEVITPLYQKAMPFLASAATMAIEAISMFAGPAVDIAVGALKLVSGAVDAVNDALAELERAGNPNAALEDEIRRVAEARGFDGEAALEQARATWAVAKAQDDARRASVEAEDAFYGAALVAGVATDAQEALRKRIEEVAKASGAPLTDVLQSAAGQLALVANGSQTLDEAMAELAKRYAGATSGSRALEGAVVMQTAAISESTRIAVEAKMAVDAYADVKLDKLVGQWDAVVAANRRAKDDTGMVEWAQQNIEDLLLVYDDLPASLKFVVDKAQRVVVESLDRTGGAWNARAEALVNGLNGLWTGVVEGSKDAAEQLGPNWPDSPAAATRRNVADMFTTMKEAKEPWKAAWRNMADWAKDPFRPGAFETWMEQRHKAALRKAREAAEDGKEPAARRWRAIARAMKSPILAALVEMGIGVDEAIARIIEIQAMAKRVEPLAIVVTGANGGTPPPNAAGGRHGGGPTMVGEAGREIYWPDSAGFVMNNTNTERLLSALQGPDTSSSRTVNHQGTFRHVIELSSATMEAARRLGATWDDLGRMASTASSGLIASPDRAFRRYEV